MKLAQKARKSQLTTERSFWQKLRHDVIRDKYLYIMLLPCLAYYIIFHYFRCTDCRLHLRTIICSQVLRIARL